MRRPAGLPLLLPGRPQAAISSSSFVARSPRPLHWRPTVILDTRIPSALVTSPRSLTGLSFQCSVAGLPPFCFSCPCIPCSLVTWLPALFLCTLPFLAQPSSGTAPNLCKLFAVALIFSIHLRFSSFCDFVTSSHLRLLPISDLSSTTPVTAR